MTAVNLTSVLAPAVEKNTLVPGLVVLGWEDACAYLEAAEELAAPIILQAGPGCRAHTSIPVIGKMLRHLADQADIPVVCHLDHGYSAEECLAALDHGFTSVMFDGSKLPIEENIKITREIAESAHKADVSVEGEVGFVGYAEGAQSASTDLDEVRRFNDESLADAIAVSVGNVHLQENSQSQIDFAQLEQIEACTSLPLVIHGGSGVSSVDRLRLARETRVCKINIGTELRQAFGTSLRSVLQNNPQTYDRIEILKATMPDLKSAARQVLSQFTEGGREG